MSYGLKIVGKKKHQKIEKKSQYSELNKLKELK